jgi:hypothetical protein
VLKFNIHKAGVEKGRKLRELPKPATSWTFENYKFSGIDEPMN